jgi:fructokinase
MELPLDIVAIGEVLWDVFPDERHLGGAPFNFAAHCCQLGAHSAIISRVGQDELGDEIVARAEEIGVEQTLLQRDPRHPTGQVLVALRGAGQPEYEIQRDVAYDYLAPCPAAIARVQAADVVCFGTLAQRHPVARHTILQLLEAACDGLVVCDLNLRPPHYSVETVRQSLVSCDLLKLNDDELRTVADMLGLGMGTQDALMLHLLDTYAIEMICVTMGAAGCILRTPEERVEAPGYRCDVVDTVGSGDGFAAALVIRYEEGDLLCDVADFANLVGAFIATQPGAIPRITPGALREFAVCLRDGTA